MFVKNTTLLLGLAAAFGAASARAQTSDDAAYTVTGNVALVSDYMFRGLTQTWGRPDSGRRRPCPRKRLRGRLLGIERQRQELSRRRARARSLRELRPGHQRRLVVARRALQLPLSERQSRRGRPAFALVQHDRSERRADLEMADPEVFDVADGLLRHRHGTRLPRRFERHRLSRAQRCHSARQRLERRTPCGAHEHLDAPRHAAFERRERSRLQRSRRDAEMAVRYALGGEPRRDIRRQPRVLRTHRELPERERHEGRRRHARLRDAAGHF